MQLDVSGPGHGGEKLIGGSHYHLRRTAIQSIAAVTADPLSAAITSAIDADTHVAGGASLTTTPNAPPSRYRVLRLAVQRCLVSVLRRLGHQVQLGSGSRAHGHKRG